MARLNPFTAPGLIVGLLRENSALGENGFGGSQLGDLPFQTAQERVEAAKLSAEVNTVIARLGAGAGWFVGATARSKQVSPKAMRAK